MVNRTDAATPTPRCPIFGQPCDARELERRLALQSAGGEALRAFVVAVGDVLAAPVHDADIGDVLLVRVPRAAWQTAGERKADVFAWVAEWKATLGAVGAFVQTAIADEGE